MSKNNNPKKNKKLLRRKHFGSNFSNVTETIIKQTDDQQEQLLSKLIQDLDILPNQIQKQVYELRSHILEIEPVSLLYCCFNMTLATQMGKEGEAEFSHDDNISQLVKNHVFNVLASSKPQEEQRECTMEDYEKIKFGVGKLHQHLTHFTVSLSVNEARENKDSQALGERTYFSRLRWLMSNGNRYTHHQVEYHVKLLQSQEKILESCFGVSVSEIAEGIDKLIYAHTYQTVDSYSLMRKIQYEFFDYLDSASVDVQALEPPEQMKAFEVHSGKSAQIKEAMDSLFKTKLIDAKVSGWNERFLQALTWKLGEAQFFFDEPNPGWPTKSMPSMERPFINIEGNVYFIDLYILFDHLYRSIEAAVVKINPSLREDWNKNQKVASEIFTSEILEEIVPTTPKLQNLYYRAPIGDGNKEDWCEIDEIKICGDNLLLIEIKASPFKNFSPYSNVDGEMDVLNTLITKPFIQQLYRILSVLELKKEIKLFYLKDKKYEEAFMLKRNDFSSVTLCAVSIDNISFNTANKNDLKVLGIDTDKFPVWAVCMDDLLVCRDMFKSPLIFLHYLQERKKASQSEILNIADEIDHMAAYFTHLNYAKRAENIAFGGKLQLLGYQALFDKYYAYVNMHPGQSPLPTIKAPKFCLEIINFLWKKLGYEARPFVFYMLNYGFTDVLDIENQYEKYISEQQIDNRLKVLHYGNENGITLYAAPRSFLNTQSKESLKKYLSAIMRARSGSERLLLIVELDDSWSFIKEVDAEVIKINLQIGDENSELEALNFKSRQLKKRLLEKSNKLGRNDFCPCGSGKKYKQCCELIKNVLLS